MNNVSMFECLKHETYSGVNFYLPTTIQYQYQAVTTTVSLEKYPSYLRVKLVSWVTNA